MVRTGWCRVKGSACPLGRRRAPPRSPTHEQGWDPAEVKVGPQLRRQVVHTGRNGANVEAFRLRNQMLKHVRGHSPRVHDGPVGQCENSRLRTRYLLVPARSRHQAAPHAWPEGPRRVPRDGIKMILRITC